MDKTITLAMITKGGAGSLFVYANFLFHLKEYLNSEPIKIIVIGHKSTELNDLIFSRGDLADEYYSAEEVKRAWECDVAFEINFYPYILLEEPNIASRSAKLYGLLRTWESFFVNDRARLYLSQNMHRDFNTYIYSQIIGKTFVNIGDIGDVLGIKENFVWKLEINDAQEILSHWNLVANEYITVQCGATPGIKKVESPKQWPHSHYEELISLIRKKYPNKTIIQVGEKDNSFVLSATDLNLLGQTNWKQLAAILKHSWLHIDGECGMVHLKEALHSGPSAVIFGPTPIDFYGYKNNINVRSDECPYPCARISDYWLERCMRGCDVAPCMNELSATEVMDAIVKRECLLDIGKGLDINRIKFYNEDLCRDERILIDEEYKKRYLDYFNVYDYELVKVPLYKLQLCVMGERKFEWEALEDTPAYKMLEGDEKCYEDYIELLKKNNNDNVHTINHYKNLINKVEEEGFDNRWRIIVGNKYKVFDGQHRAAIMAAKYGLDYEAEVLRIRKIALFPFDKINRGSRIMLYGAGGIGYDYYRQLEITGYCTVVTLIDKFPFLWNDNIERRSKAFCISPEQILEYKGEYDYIVISSNNDVFVDEISNNLEQMGIDKKIIISRCR